jgi:YbbR domain-containing protein
MLAALVRHWELKILAIALAVVVWFFVVSADRSQIGFPAPLEYVGLEPGMVLIGTPRESVDVHVEAARWAAARLTPATVRVRVDLSRTREGDNLLMLADDQVQTPAGVNVVRVSPNWVRVTVVSATTRSVRVVPQLRGTPAPDVLLGSVVVEPATVQVKGPRTTIEDRATIETVPVDVSGIRESVTRTVGLQLPESVYPTTQRTVQVTVEVREDPMRQRRSGGAR